MKSVATQMKVSSSSHAVVDFDMEKKIKELWGDDIIALYRLVRDKK